MFSPHQDRLGRRHEGADEKDPQSEGVELLAIQARQDGQVTIQNHQDDRARRVRRGHPGEEARSAAAAVVRHEDPEEGGGAQEEPGTSFVLKLQTKKEGKNETKQQPNKDGSQCL